MPVFAINADPSFDITSIARRDGLDLFNEPRLQLIEALGLTPHNSQVERLWGDWPQRLEGNRNNLRAELERIIAAASARRDQNHVIMFILNEFAPAPNDTVQHVSRDLLLEVKQAIEGRDRRGYGIETAATAQNVWVVVFLRPPQEPERAAQAAHEANHERLVNNIFVSVFNGRESDRVAVDFLVLRVLAELLLDDSESRRFLQVGVQNAYPVTCVIGPTKAPSGGASALLQRALYATLDELETQGAPAAGSVAISVPASQLSNLVKQLVPRARDGVDVQPTVDTATADLAQAAALETAIGSVHAADRLDAIFRKADVHLRPRRGFGELRRQLALEVAREENYHARESEEWAKHRAEKLRSFSGINVDIGKAINELSKAAIGSRGNDIKVLEDLVTEVRREREDLKRVAQECRGRNDGTHDDGGMTAQMARLNAARRAFEFELDQTPNPYSMSFYILLSLLPATVPFLMLGFSDSWRGAIYLALAMILPVFVILAAAVAIGRRHKKLKQAIADLRSEFTTWRALSARSFNQALRYQTATLAIGWLTSIAEKLHQIKRSIELRGEALQDCREMLGANATIDSQASQRLVEIVTSSVDRLRTLEWDKWIVEFLRGAPPSGMQADVRVFLANDGETRIVKVPGLAQLAAPGSRNADLEIRTPHTLAAWSLDNKQPPDGQGPRPLVPA